MKENVDRLAQILGREMVQDSPKHSMQRQIIFIYKTYELRRSVTESNMGQHKHARTLRAKSLNYERFHCSSINSLWKMDRYSLQI